MKPTAFDLYRTHHQVRALLDALRADCHERGEFGAAQALDSACYYLYGAFGWLVQDLSPQEREALEQQLEQFD